MQDSPTQVNLSRHGLPTKTHKCLGSKMGCWGWWEEGGQSEIGWRNLVLISLRSVGRGLPSANAPPVNMWTDPLLLLLISQHSAARVCRSPILMLWLLRRWCYVRQTTATCCYKLELMLGQYNWLLHSCHSALSKAIWWRPGALPLSVNILHPPRLAAIATLLIEDGLPIIVRVIFYSCKHEVAEFQHFEWRSLRKLVCRHSSLVEQAVRARGRRCFDQNLEKLHHSTHPHPLIPHQLSHFFKPLSNISFIFLPSLKTETLHKQWGS